MHSIFISGAAQGIGAAIATLFYQHGYKVGIYDINIDQAQALAQQLGTRAKAGLLDVSDYSQWQHTLSEFQAWCGEINVLVNNAGAFSTQALLNRPILPHIIEPSISMSKVC